MAVFQELMKKRLHNAGTALKEAFTLSPINHEQKVMKYALISVRYNSWNCLICYSQICLKWNTHPNPHPNPKPCPRLIMNKVMKYALISVRCKFLELLYFLFRLFLPLPYP